MRIPGLAHGYERTCQDCGHARRVPKWAVHPRMQGLPIGAGRGPLGSGATFGTATAAVAGAAAVADANAELAERVAVLRQCPECESVHYKQRAIRP